MSNFPPAKPESIDSLLEKAESDNSLIGVERKALRMYLKNTISGAGNSALRPVVQERVSRIRNVLNLRLPGRETNADDVIDAFNRILKEAPISAALMRFSCFLDPRDIPFFLLEASAEDVPGLAELLKTSDNAHATILSVLEPLERNGLVTIDRENEGFSTTPQIQQAIKDKDYS